MDLQKHKRLIIMPPLRTDHTGQHLADKLDRLPAGERPKLFYMSAVNWHEPATEELAQLWFKLGQGEAWPRDRHGLVHMCRVAGLPPKSQVLEATARTKAEPSKPKKGKRAQPFRNIDKLTNKHLPELFMSALG